MDRYDFINQLRDALVGQVPPDVIDKNLRFYDQYISEELNKGRTESEVFAGLGDPRLIARSIIDANQSDRRSSGAYVYSDAGENPFVKYTDTIEPDGTSKSSREKNSRGKTREKRRKSYSDSYININGFQIDTDKWYIRALPFLIIGLILLLIMCVLIGFLQAVIYILTSPVFWIAVIVIVVVIFLSSRRRYY